MLTATAGDITEGDKETLFRKSVQYISVDWILEEEILEKFI